MGATDIINDIRIGQKNTYGMMNNHYSRINTVKLYFYLFNLNQLPNYNQIKLKNIESKRNLKQFYWLDRKQIKCRALTQKTDIYKHFYKQAKLI